MRLKKTMLVLVSGGTLFAGFNCGSGGNLALFFDTINQLIQTGHALGAI
jgi:hypothetical protein